MITKEVRCTKKAVGRLAAKSSSADVVTQLRIQCEADQRFHLLDS